jgi:hypothetical protein
LRVLALVPEAAAAPRKVKRPTTAKKVRAKKKR